MRRTIVRSAGRGAVLLALALVTGAACGAFEESPPPATATPTRTNILVDAGFETTNPPAWRWAIPAFAAPFAPATDTVRTGTYAARLAADPANPVLASITQAIAAADVPEFFSGYYRVASWPDDENAYLEWTIRVAAQGAEPVREVRFLIAGAQVEPAPQSADARYVFLSRDPPVIGEWTYFAYPIQEALRAAGGVPSGVTGLDVTIAIHASGDSTEPLAAYFDDLYVGTQLGNPNRPKEHRE
jgi:hypothetical protein